MADLNTGDYVRIYYKILVDGTDAEVELPPEQLQLIPRPWSLWTIFLVRNVLQIQCM